jgi:hypothetical protein
VAPHDVEVTIEKLGSPESAGFSDKVLFPVFVTTTAVWMSLWFTRLLPKSKNNVLSDAVVVVTEACTALARPGAGGGEETLAGAPAATSLFAAKSAVGPTAARRRVNDSPKANDILAGTVRALLRGAGEKRETRHPWSCSCMNPPHQIDWVFKGES